MMLESQFPAATSQQSLPLIPLESFNSTFFQLNIPSFKHTFKGDTEYHLLKSAAPVVFHRVYQFKLRIDLQA